jgi:aspartate/methionine/tyrosine aminotransferase
MNPALFASRLDNIAPFHVMEMSKMAAELEAQGRSIIRMGIGEPDFTAPQPVIDAATLAMNSGELRYTSATGLPALREAIAQYYADRFGVDVAPSRIVITSGASAALLLVCAALLEKGTEVLMPDPCYPCNRHFVAAFDGVATMIPCGAEQRFQLTADRVEAHWRDATRGVLLASPSNPTGTSIAPDELKKIHQVVQQRGGFTIVDEIYQGLSYEEPGHKPFSALSIDQNIIVINSFSKYFNMTGWRLGWVVLPPSLIAPIEKLAQHLFICASSLAQRAALACFAPETLAIYESRKAEFKRRRDYLVPALQRLGFIVPVVPDGAFYVYADCSALDHDADRLSKEILQHTGVVIVPGLDFGPSTARHFVRISYATSMHTLETAIERLSIFFAQRVKSGITVSELPL